MCYENMHLRHGPPSNCPSSNWLIAIILIFISVLPLSTHAQVPKAELLPTQEASEAKSSLAQVLERASFGASPYQPMRGLKEGGGFLLDRQNRWTLALGATAVLGAKSLDGQAQEFFDHKGRLGDFAKLGNDYLGTGIPGTLLGAGFWIFGELAQSPYATHSGQAQIESLLITGLISAALKGALQRKRPDGSDHYSFPSGHVSTAFASAMVLQEFYGWKAGVPAYLLGAITAAGRLSDNRHWLSDTVGGAALGLLVGHAFSRAHLNRYNAYAAEEAKLKGDSAVDRRNPGRKISFFPTFERGGGRMVMRVTF